MNSDIIVAHKIRKREKMKQNSNFLLNYADMKRALGIVIYEHKKKKTLKP